MNGSKIDTSEKGRSETSDAGIKEEHTREINDGRMRRESVKRLSSTERE